MVSTQTEVETQIEPQQSSIALGLVERLERSRRILYRTLTESHMNEVMSSYYESAPAYGSFASSWDYYTERYNNTTHREFKRTEIVETELQRYRRCKREGIEWIPKVIINEEQSFKEFKNEHV